MKKKFLVILLCMALSASITACNGTSNKNTETSKTEVSTKEKSESKEYISVETMKSIPKFKCKDINGKEVSNEIFKGKKLTLITFWGTW